MTKLWKILGAMTGKGRSRHFLQTLALSSNKSAEEAAENLCAQYTPVEAPERPREPNMTPGPIGSPFAVQELQSALKKCRKKSRAESYRPVALSSCLSKLFERLLQARLSWYLEKHERLPKCMTGFRKGLSAQDSILDLTSDLEDNKYRQRNTVVVFLDVERAYDGVPLSSILGRLTEVGLTGKIQAFLRSFLTGRRIQVRDSGIVSTPTPRASQGSVLSPTLFNIVMAKLPQSIPRTALPEKADCMPGSKIKQVHKQRFLGIILTRQLKWAQAVKAVMDVCRPAANAIRCMRGTSWGCSERTLAAAHGALVSSRVLYRLPYMTPPQTDGDKLELVQRCGLRTAMGTSNSETAATTGKTFNLHPSSWLLTQLQDRKQSKGRTVIGEFLFVASPLPAETNDARVAPCDVAEISCEIRIEHLRSKKVKPPLLAKSSVEDHLKRKHCGKLHICTGGSVNRARTSSTAAFHIPETGAEWSGKLEVATSSARAELVAIERALNAAAELPPQQIVILSDSKCALQRLVNPSFSDPLTTAVRHTVGELEKQGTAVYLQWIPGHVGVKGNEKADSLATEALKKTASIIIPADPLKAIQDVQWHVQSERPEPALPRGSLVGFSRAASSLVRRLRTNTAYTNEFLCRTGKIPDPSCPSCNEVELDISTSTSTPTIERHPPASPSDIEKQLANLPRSVTTLVFHVGRSELERYGTDETLRRCCRLVNNTLRPRPELERLVVSLVLPRHTNRRLNQSNHRFLHWFNTEARKFNNTVKDYCRKPGKVTFLDHDFTSLPPLRVLAADGLHPRFTGVALVAENLKSILQRGRSTTSPGWSSKIPAAAIANCTRMAPSEEPRHPESPRSHNASRESPAAPVGIPGAIVILSTSEYIREGYRQLNDPKFYEPLAEVVARLSAGDADDYDKRLLKAYSKPTSSGQRLYHRPFEVSLAPEGLLRMEPSATFSEFQRCGNESRNESRRVRTAGHLSKPAQNVSQRVRDVNGTCVCVRVGSCAPEGERGLA
ncbi:hypothetical protein HPB47_016100 [Ixodes persulcatus]|uniref:Uncharacterized protein n=1 Tax=Ixodes persulcatus TaxID=34615 RepID=A0AC60QSM2_IXOPE|nr:hypothetical protein HPB47_016100 [Ixodes persulcatus]